MLEADKRLIEDNKRTCSWFGSYGIVPHLAEMVDTKSILEIGVVYGYHADFMCTVLPRINYGGVDPYEAGYARMIFFSKMFKDYSVRQCHKMQ